MPRKSDKPLTQCGYTIEEEQKRILDDEALARRYNGTSELVREIFRAWIEEFHNP